MTALPTQFPRVPLKQMDPSMLVFELDRETHRLMPEETELITSAATMASFLHRKQSRSVRGDLPRVPYIEHPLRVGLRLIRWGVHDAEVIAAALLHDVAEDCGEELLEVFGQDDETVQECLGRLYGRRVAGYVVEVTNPEDGTSYADHVRGLAAVASPALLIKASDLKDNAGSLRHQLGYGENQAMFRRARKYSTVIGPVIAGLRSMALDPDIQDPAAAAELEMLGLNLELQKLNNLHAQVEERRKREIRARAAELEGDDEPDNDHSL